MNSRIQRQTTDNSETNPRQESPLLAYYNYLWEVPDNELHKVLQKNMKKYLQFLRDIVNPDEVMNTVHLLLRVLKLDIDVEIKTGIVSVVFTEISRQLDVFTIYYIPFVRNSQYRENPAKFLLSIFELIHELIKLKHPLHKEQVVRIYLNCKKLISYNKNKETLNLAEIHTSIIMNDLKTYLDLKAIESMNFYLSQHEIEKYNADAITFKSLKEFKSFEEYFKWYYSQIKGEFICNLSKAMKKLYEDSNSDNDNNEFQVIINCTGKVTRNGVLRVTVGECKQKYFENEEFTPGCLVCFSFNNYQTYTFGNVLSVNSDDNIIFVSLIDSDPRIISKTFSMAAYKLHYYKTIEIILQAIQKKFFKDLPFEEYIFSGINGCTKQPKYLQKASEYNIDDLKFKPCDTKTWPPKEYFQLNAEQYVAFQHLITNELALLIGYPGSGKTHVVLKLIHLLLKNKQIWHQDNAGPILILAYTNKSLDNFMEKILPLTDSLVRIGTQTTIEKFKKPLEQKVSRVLLDIRDKISNIAWEMSEFAKEAQAVLLNGGIISTVYLGISKICNQSFYDKLMENNETERIALMNELLSGEENPVTEVNPVCSRIYYVTVSDLQARHDKNSSYLQWRLTHKEAHKKFYSQNGVDYNNILNLSGNELWSSYFYLADHYLNKLREQINILNEQKQRLWCNLQEEENIHNTKELKQKMVVGMTFSGAAIRKALIDGLNSPIVIIEEASYIEHFHVLGTIPESCKHLIVIGDTKPEFKISQTRNNSSLVDNLLENNYPIEPLKIQFRMKSEIAFLLKALSYTDMVDDESVKKIPNVPGIPKPIFFVNHCIENNNDKCVNWKTAINAYEFEYLAQLAKFLLTRGVSAVSVTILTVTRYQALEFDKVKGNDEALQKVKSCSIDDFPSMENDIILLSLFGINDHFRSFLNKENKLCMALSRSKQGLYLIGNMEKLCKQQHIWTSLRDLLKENNNIGNALPISCPLHNGKECAFIEKPEDFLNLESHYIRCSGKFKQ